MATTATSQARELAFREADGLEVALLWHRHEGLVTVSVNDSKSGEAFELVLAESDNALDVFHHPFAYAAHRGLEPGASDPALAIAA